MRLNRRGRPRTKFQRVDVEEVSRQEPVEGKDLEEGMTIIYLHRGQAVADKIVRIYPGRLHQNVLFAGGAEKLLTTARTYMKITTTTEERDSA